MMQAWKCDRCGKFYIKEIQERKYNILDVNMQQLDLCIECQSELNNFIERSDGIATKNI